MMISDGGGGMVFGFLLALLGLAVLFLFLFWPCPTIPLI